MRRTTVLRCECRAKAASMDSNSQLAGCAGVRSAPRSNEKALEQRACSRIARQGTIALDLLEQLAERTERRLNELDAASGGGDRAAAVHVRSNWRNNAGLSDARFARDQYDAPAARGRLATITRQEAHLALARHEHTGDVRGQRFEIVRQKQPCSGKNGLP